MSEPALQGVAPSSDDQPSLLVAAALAMAAEATKIAPELGNQIAVATETGAWRLLAGNGDPGSAAQVLNTARSRLRPGREREALISAGPRSWVAPFVVDGSVVGCLILFAEHDRPLLVPPTDQLTAFAERAAALLARIRDRERAATAERLLETVRTLPRALHAAPSRRAMFSTLATSLQEAIVGCSWAVVLRGAGEQTPKLVASGPESLEDDRPFIAAANRAMRAEDLDVTAPGAGEVVAPGTASVLAAPLHDRRTRPIGALVVRIPGDDGVDEQACGPAIVAIADVVSVSLDLAGLLRESRILQQCDPNTGCLSGDAFRDATEVLADACTVANKSAAFLLIHTARNHTIPDGSDAAGQALREFLDDEAEADCVIAKLGAWRYMVLAPERSPREAVALAASLRWRLRTFSPIPVASAVGIAMMPRNGVTYEALLAAASTVLDEALKAGGDKERIAPLRQVAAPVADVRIDGGRSIAMLNALASMVDQMYFDGTGHSAAVAARARDLGTLLGVSGDVLEHLTLAGGLHDIGRAVLAPELFVSIAPTKAERSLIQTHVVLGARLVSNAGFTEAAECIAGMHEWWDGHGEPHGKSGSIIPLGARILAVANAFETVVSGHGRGDSGLRAAVAAVIEQRGRAFDPDVVDCLLDSLRAD